jgi:hypothetical protein
MEQGGMMSTTPTAVGPLYIGGTDPSKATVIETGGALTAPVVSAGGPTSEILETKPNPGVTIGTSAVNIPMILFTNTEAALDEKNAWVALQGGSLQFEFADDAITVNSPFLEVLRSGVTPTQFNVTAEEFNTSSDATIGGNLTVTDNATVDGTLTATGAVTAEGALTAASLAVTGDANLGTVEANDATFATCEVDNSPVRTFANTAEGAGPSYPPAGIGVSTGTAWDTTSIDPATVPRLNLANTFTAAQSMAGLNLPPVAGAGSANRTISFGPGFGQPAIMLYDLSPTNRYGWGLQNGEMQFYVSAAAHYSWNNAGDFSPSGTSEMMRLDPTNGLTVKGTAVAGTQIASFMEPNATSGSVWLELGKTAANNSCGSIGYDVVNNQLDFTIYGASSNMTLDSSGNLTVSGTLNVNNGLILAKSASALGGSTPNIRTLPTGDIVINPIAPGNVFINWDSGSGATLFGDGNGHNMAQIDGTGHANFVSLAVSGTKNFRIVHPLNKKKYLTHSCVEGPEAAVFYRGEGKTNKSGRATVTLPDYFEALTHESGRTVQLTAIIEDDDDDFGQLAASRVEDGRFRVRSALPLQRFCWEVKAVRADIAPLEVVTPRKATDDGPTAERMREATRGFVPAKKKARKR